jgi:hypothetical protein
MGATGAIKSVLSGVAFLLPFFSAYSEPPPSLGLAIVYDTSGSMREAVRDRSGKSAPKYQIANNALMMVVDRLAAFHKTHADLPLRTSLVVFSNNGGRDAVPFGEFDAERFRVWIRGFAQPSGATPLGNAIREAAQPLLRADLQHKHILVITDGQNTSGPDPATVIPGLRAELAKKGGRLGIHFVAFDVAAKVFEPVKKLDATVVSAADEKQLDEQLSMILERKILLEDEEPAPKKS